jgi:hypothetical protein
MPVRTHTVKVLTKTKRNSKKTSVLFIPVMSYTLGSHQEHGIPTPRSSTVCILQETDQMKEDEIGGHVAGMPR